MLSRLKIISAKKKKLDALFPLPGEITKNLEEWYKVELTYSSNAIEGNTLSRIETAEVIEKGMKAVISGKPVKDILEARNHSKAIDFIRDLARLRKSHQQITEDDIKATHKIILEDIDDNWAGKYRMSDVFVRGSDMEFPRPNAVPYAMGEFIDWLHEIQDEHPVRIAADVHFRLVGIHPFIDGNGRTARLLMNLILIIHGYPMAVIRNEDRTRYLSTFDMARKQNNTRPFYAIIEEAVERSLDMYLKAVKDTGKLMKIGELAKRSGETVHTIRFWTKMELLDVTSYTAGGYQLYDSAMVKQAKQIRRWQSKNRLTLQEIKEKLAK